MMSESSSSHSARTILLINGPNLNLLGTREPDTYGTTTLADIEEMVAARASAHDSAVSVKPFQSNHEGEITDFIQDAGPAAAGIIINPGAFTHYSYAIRDVLAAVDRPTVEVHISNIHTRESFRHTSVTVPVVLGQICGLGPAGYSMALDYLMEITD